MRYAGLLILLLLTSAQARIVSETEPNDYFNTATPIECGDTVQCANLDISAADYYRVIIPGGDSVYFRTFSCGENANTLIILHDSTQGFMAINDDGGPGQFSTLGVFLPTNQLCYVQVVHPTRSSLAPYSLSFECLAMENEPHDLCSNARPITFFPYYDESSTLGADDEVGTAAPDVFYELTLPTPGDIFVRVCSEGFDSRVQVILRCVGDLMDDAYEGNCGLGADLYSFGLQAQTYYLYVEGTSASQFGEFTIEVSPLLQECPEPQQLMIFDVGGSPFLDWLDVPEADYYAIEQSSAAEGPYEIVAVADESFWQDPVGYGLTRRFYRVRAICE